jgi:HTH-type transcriptional regulator / antitoxin HipB
MTATAEAFGRRIARERKARGWSQVELARKAGLRASKLVSNYEAGASEPVLSNAAALARALGVSLDALIAPPGCETCDGIPPAGMTCNACGRSAVSAPEPQASRTGTGCPGTGN